MDKKDGGSTNWLRESPIKSGKGLLELINLFCGIEILSGKWLYTCIRGESNSGANVQNLPTGGDREFLRDR